MKIKAIAIAAVLTAVSMTGFSPSATVTPVTVTAEAASTLSIEEAAEKLAAAEKKAYNKKKNVTVTVKVPCKSKKKIESTLKTLFDTTAAIEVGVEPEHRIGVQMASRPNYTENSDEYHYLLFNSVTKCNGKATLSGKVLTAQLTVKGNKKDFRNNYENNYYTTLNVTELRSRVEGMSEKDKAWAIGQWVDERMYYVGTQSNTKYWTAKKLYEGEATGKCASLATVYQQYAGLLGLEVAYVSGSDHAWNAVRIDGEVYHLGMQNVAGYTDSYETLVVNPSREWVCEFYGIKPWDSNYSIGEYCLLTSEERYAVLTDCGDDFASPSEWGYRWFGSAS